MDIKAGWCLMGFLGLTVCGVGRADTLPLTRMSVEGAITDPRRPDDQVKLDATRKPAISVQFSETKAGDRIADVMPGNGYFTRILSDVVGPGGHVYAYIPAEQIAHCSPREIAGTQAIARDSSYTNVTLLTGSLANFRLPEKLDLIWMSRSYHDLHDSFLGPANLAVVNKVIFDALKPGGVFLVIDHVAEAGSGLRDTETLHRIDPIRMTNEIQAAGFVLESHNDALRNPGDDHKQAIFDPKIRGRTDQVILRFRKPQ
jgi:predicted methyltransferase